MKYSHLVQARRVYEEGGNVAEYLRRFEKNGLNTETIIEIAYELQAGTYTEAVLRNMSFWNSYTEELAGWLDDCIEPDDRVMEIGCGECTTFAGIFRHIVKAADFYCFDLSWSRIAKARQFVAQFLSPDTRKRLKLFVAEISRMPIADKSIDVLYTAHSLEPNGGHEVELLKTLFRVARKKVVLFEPHFERASAEAQQRMASHGYVRGLEEATATAGGRLERVEPIRNIANPLNPTFVFEITPPASENLGIDVWACPVSGSPLTRRQNVFWCRDAGLVYPIIDDIPVLRPDAAILATAFDL